MDDDRPTSASPTASPPVHPARRRPTPGSVIDVREAALERLWDLLRHGSVVGAEQPFLDHLEEEARTEGHRVRRSEGVLELSRKGWKGPALSAHVDRHGLVALEDDTFGYAAHVVREDTEDDSSHATRGFIESLVERFDEEEMFAYDPSTGKRLGRAVADPSHDPRHGRLTVHVEGLEHVPPGTPVAFTPPTREQRHGEVISGQIDNALPVAIALELMDRGIAGRLLLTREEEVGRSADHVLAHLADRRLPQLLVLDTSPFPDDGPARRGAVVLRYRDAGETFDARITGRLQLAARRAGVEIVLKDRWIEDRNLERISQGLSPRGLGRTELGRMVDASDGRIRGSTVQVPTWDYHTSAESTTVAAVDAFVGLLVDVLDPDAAA